MIKVIKVLFHNEGEQGEDQYGGGPSEDVGPPFPPVSDQQLIHLIPSLLARQASSR
jgi:hypothetical protein